MIDIIAKEHPMIFQTLLHYLDILDYVCLDLTCKNIRTAMNVYRGKQGGKITYHVNDLYWGGCSGAITLESDLLANTKYVIAGDITPRRIDYISMNDPTIVFKITKGPWWAVFDQITVRHTVNGVVRNDTKNIPARSIWKASPTEMIKFLVKQYNEFHNIKSATKNVIKPYQ